MTGKDPLLGFRRPCTRSFAIDLDAVIGPVVTPIVVALSAIVVVLAVLEIALWRRTGALDRRFRGLTRGAQGRSLEAVLDAHLDKVYAVASDVDDLAARTDVLEAAGRKAFSRVGLVRFNPFEETGGNQSFALALLDADGDGWVLSSLHARSGTRVYAKAIKRARSDAALSEEESAAIRQATG
ncbi:MAG: DUF4446 family protein [Candidatus Limnocylindrales bacterium]